MEAEGERNMREATVRRCGLAAVAAISLILGPSTSLTAQAPTGSDIFLIPVAHERGAMRFGAPQNITGRSGYDNQPSFTPDGTSILYTSIRDGQADIFRYEIASHSTRQVTRTAESEYSATVMPGGDAFSTVRVEADSSQRLWAFDLDGDNPYVLLEELRPVGYYAWIDTATVALFVLGSPPNLHIVDLRSGRSEIVAHDIGRSLHKIPGRQAVSFVHRMESGSWIAEVDVASHEIRHLVPPVRGNEFYVWMPSAHMLTGAGTKIFRWTGAGEWQEVADFTDGTISGITRLALSPDGSWLAVVAEDR